MKWRERTFPWFDASREILATSKSDDEDDAEDYDDVFDSFFEAQRNKQPPPNPIHVPRQSRPSKEDPRSQPKNEDALQGRNRNLGTRSSDNSKLQAARCQSADQIRRSH